MKYFPTVFIATSLGLVACGGGDGASTPTSTPTTPTTTTTAEGVYSGTFTGGAGGNFEAVVLENGDVWSLYGQNSGSTFYVYGFIQGNGTSNNGTYTASTVKDYGTVPVSTGSLSGTYSTTAKTFSGTVSYINGVKSTFSGSQMGGSGYSYTSAPSLSTVSGRWTLVSLTGEGVGLTVASNGTFTLISTGGCSGSGTISPRPSGKNIFDVAIKFGSSPCQLPNQTATGIAITYPLSTGQTQLIAAAIDPAHTMGTAVFGVR